ncbi:MAG: phosphate/phosphite/phosphonate ABC transporter substrate-binding protein [Gammaproteobacteria bacterium]|nr:phosphate/phosphite/phosphonate ABC transporter substrate-binding protein [Gammaproteobacteria bacterium]
MKKNHFVFILTFLALILMNISVNADEYKIGVLAKNGAAKALKKWSATADYLNASLKGSTFKIVPLGFEEVFPAIEGKNVDFFLVNSSMFITAKVKYNAAAIATMINSRQGKSLTSFGGVILTYIDRDDINSLADIKGKNFMAVKKSSFGGWQMAYKEFLDNGINPKKDFASLKFGGKHDNVVLSIQNGEIDAGTVRTDTLERMAAVGDIDMSEFKILAKKNHSGFPFVVSTSLYPEWPFAKLADISDEISNKVMDALSQLDAESKAAKDAKIIGWSAPLDYSEIEVLQEQLGVGAYR